MIKRIFTLFGAIIFGLMASVWIIQNNSKIEVALSQKLISKLENIWGITITKQSARINFFTCSIYLKNGLVSDPRKKNCNWKFEQCKIHVSPLAFILKRKINLSLEFYNVAAKTIFNDGKLEIADHIANMLADRISGLDVNLKSIRINNLDCEINTQTNKIHLFSVGNCIIQKHEKKDHKKYSWSGKINFNDAQINIDDNVIAQKINVRCNFDKLRDESGWEAKFDSKIKDVPPIPNKQFLLDAHWNKAYKQINATTSDKSLNIAIEYLKNSLNINGFFKLADMVNIFNYLSSHKNEFVAQKEINGQAQINASLGLELMNLNPKSKVVISDVNYKMFACKELSLELIKNGTKSIISKIGLELASDIKFNGICAWNFKNKKGVGKFLNSCQIKPLKNQIVNLGFGDYVIYPKNAFISVSFDSNLELDGKYKAIINNQTTDQNTSFDGTYKFCNKELSLDGNCKDDLYSLQLQTIPNLHFSKIKYSVANNSVINFKTKHKNDVILSGDVNYSLLRQFLDPSTKNLLLSHGGLFNLQIDQANWGKLRGKLNLKNGSFYIPESQNLINKFDSEFELVFPRKIYLNNLKVGFFKGEISSPKVSITLDKSFAVSFLHFPIQITDLLINYKKDLLGIIYGNVLIKKDVNSESNVFGQIYLKKSLLKENIFAASDKYNFYGGWNSILPSTKDINFDIKIVTEYPIKAKTPTLQTNASLNLRITHKRGNGIINIPQLTGTVKLDGGFIKVLQNKLMIEYGKIEFVANQMNDPVIDLIAKNRINKYMVSMQASGSLQKPTILVESTPELTEEQVLSLLLSGSENYKLQTDLLAMVEQNLYNVILGSKKILPESNNLLHKITKPLKYIQISPDFTDQSARGGIKGTININVNDQVKAQIQKNFNLQDDFSAQLEYMLSDDINVRAIKDQRGELGAEVELRVKF
ncbi:MAG: hypothetical protein US49_C0003G0086 [candidate division TM6 bacterium GW2011_GWF2_37_49]|nr:MAG: hypothetical protein US49_C0003G0086 [candidate division TM6 bacterium GW2011_GWF2_37_49]